MSGSNRCDCCCVCGAFCSNAPYCGRDMWWVATYSGATDGTVNSPPCTCTDLNAATSITSDAPASSTDAATWNAGRPSYSTHDAKDGTRVCSWLAADDVVSTCGSGETGVIDASITIYQGDDDKWRMLYEAYYYMTLDGEEAYLGGEAEFPGGGAATDCGEPAEGTPTFSLSITLTTFNESAAYGNTCNAPTSVLVEGNPQ